MLQLEIIPLRKCMLYCCIMYYRISGALIMVMLDVLGEKLNLWFIKVLVMIIGWREGWWTWGQEDITKCSTSEKWSNQVLVRGGRKENKRTMTEKISPLIRLEGLQQAGGFYLFILRRTEIYWVMYSQPIVPPFSPPPSPSIEVFAPN